MSDQLLRQIYNDPLDADICIYMHSGETFYAHSLVLKNQSPMLRAMLSGDWVEATSGQLRFTNSDVAVMCVMRAVYLGDSSAPSSKIYKVLKFAHYLQMDDIIKQLATYRISKAPHLIKIAVLLQDYNKSLYDMYAQKLPWNHRQCGWMCELHALATGATPDECAWCVENIRGVPCSDCITMLFNVFHAGSYNAISENRRTESDDVLAQSAHQSAVEAIRSIGRGLVRAKSIVSEAFKYRYIPDQYANMLAIAFNSMVSSCGCNMMNSRTCSDCGYQYCDDCRLWGKARCWTCRGRVGDSCPRCKFVVSIGRFNDICVACVATLAKSRGIMYCRDHAVVITCEQQHLHDKCDVTHDHNATMVGYTQQYSEQLAQVLSRRFETLVWLTSGVSEPEGRLRDLWTVLQSVSATRCKLNADAACMNAKNNI